MLRMTDAGSLKPLASLGLLTFTTLLTFTGLLTLYTFKGSTTATTRPAKQQRDDTNIRMDNIEHRITPTLPLARVRLLTHPPFALKYQ